LRNATVGVQRLIARLRPGPGHRSAAAVTFQRHSLSIARFLGVGSASRPRRDTRGLGSTRHIRPSVERPAARSGPTGERLASITAVGLVAVALVLSNVGNDATAGPTGNTNGNGNGSEPRIALGGAVSGLENAPQGGIDDRVAGGAFDGRLGAELGDLTTGPTGPAGLAPVEQVPIEGPFSSDGTLLKPVSVDTNVDDGSDLLRTYRVKSGDTLVGIASKFHVSMMTVWWANDLKNKNDLKIGQTLTIPPVNGLVITVRASDTLESVAAKYHAEPTDIIEVNELTDPVLVIGQTLTIPGARSAQIPTPKPTKAPTTRPTTSHSSGGSSGGSTRPPSQYTGGKFAWPVAGGYISQYFHYGHYGLDIAADRGTRVKAAAGGTVTFAGWKNNGGGYQVWIAHGSGLYTTYNHMMSVAVGRGQHVGRGQQVGRIGMTGNATGPHLHFEVWRGPIWDGGTRVNPLGYL
jgi:murein DD-endopeptidase MepM/ murein hydrolase activator NlpD